MAKAKKIKTNWKFSYEYAIKQWEAERVEVWRLESEIVKLKQERNQTLQNWSKSDAVKYARLQELEAEVKRLHKGYMQKCDDLQRANVDRDRLEAEVKRLTSPFKPFKVVCIDDSPGRTAGSVFQLTKGKIYTVTAVWPGIRLGYTIEGVPHGSNSCGWDFERFIKIVE